MNRVGDINTRGLKGTGDLTQRVLSLGHGESIARNNDHPLGRLKREGALFNTAARDVGVLTTTRTRAGACSKRSTKQHGHQGTVHAVTHHLGEDQTGSSHHRSRHNQQLTADNKTCCCCCNTGIAVQQRDHHGHISTTNRQRDANAQQTGGHHQQPQARGTTGGSHHFNGTHQRRDGQGDIHGMAQPALHPGGRRQPALQLRHRHNRTGKGDRAHEDRHDNRHQRDGSRCIECNRFQSCSQSHK